MTLIVELASTNFQIDELHQVFRILTHKDLKGCGHDDQNKTFNS